MSHSTSPQTDTPTPRRRKWLLISAFGLAGTLAYAAIVLSVAGRIGDDVARTVQPVPADAPAETVGPRAETLEQPSLPLYSGDGAAP